MALWMAMNLKVYSWTTYHMQLESYEAEQTPKNKTGKNYTNSIPHSTAILTRQNSCQEESRKRLWQYIWLY